MSSIIHRAFLTLALSSLLFTAALAQVPQLRGFPTPEAAADALTDAIRKKDDKALTAILGASWGDFAPGNDEEDEETRTRFCAAMPASRRANSKDVSRSLCFPTPLVKKRRFGTMLLPNAESSQTNLTQTNEWMRKGPSMMEKDAQ